MRLVASFFVVGVPAPQGSKTSYRNAKTGKINTVEGSSPTGRAAHKAWRTAVAEAAMAQAEGGQFTGPTSLRLVLYFERPKSRPKSHHGWSTVKPDKDKVLRSTLDGLKDGGLLRDDAQVCDFYVQAVETTGRTGARVDLRSIAYPPPT